jgi:hypothetical protein
MNRFIGIFMIVMAVVVLAMTVVFSDTLYSSQGGEIETEVIPMERYLKYSESGRLERATFALG